MLHSLCLLGDGESVEVARLRAANMELDSRVGKLEASQERMIAMLEAHL